MILEWLGRGQTAAGGNPDLSITRTIQGSACFPEAKPPTVMFSLAERFDPRDEKRLAPSVTDGSWARRSRGAT